MIPLLIVALLALDAVAIFAVMRASAQREAAWQKLRDAERKEVR